MKYFNTILGLIFVLVAIVGDIGLAIWGFGEIMGVGIEPGAAMWFQRSTALAVLGTSLFFITVAFASYRDQKSDELEEALDALD